MSTIYVISKLFTYLVLPPGIFIIFFLLASFYTKKFRAIFILVALSFFALSNSYVSELLLRPLEKPFNQTLKKNNYVNAVVVLGGGKIEGSANIPLGSAAYKRALWGLMIAKSHNLPLLFSGAGIDKYTEADAFLESMKEISKNLGVDIPISSSTFELNNFALHVEDKSLDTYQNAKFSKEKFKQIGIDKPNIYLVTSAFHMKRSIALYEYFGFKVVPAATDFRLRTKENKLTIWSFMPSLGALNNSYTALHEYAGLLSLHLRNLFSKE
ncbi:YdcF family protein [Sulfurospirillum arcachonense]|uniref:YdcF family protein n=1 Tax=Sulfurospirillum arcachonense TaxID=57666 RepID=UPI000469D370|nr:YdcF family protein [Sulfurospirillum arcachonense]